MATPRVPIQNIRPSIGVYDECPRKLGSMCPTGKHAEGHSSELPRQVIAAQLVGTHVRGLHICQTFNPSKRL